MQSDLFITETTEEIVYPNCIEYWPNALDTTHAQKLYQYFVEQVRWQQPEIIVYGNSHKIPRLQCWMADPELEYGYSDHKLKSDAWLPEVLAVKQKVEHLTGYTFNSVLLNWYRNGDDKMGWHADDEAELGLNPAIATLTLGAVRDFQFRHNNSQQTHSIPLGNGSLLLMKPGMQSSYKHQLPLRKKEQNGRISLTFRYVQPIK